MTEQEWNVAPISDLLLYTLDIHRARHGTEPERSVMLREPRSAWRVDMGRKHVLLAYAVVRCYWQSLDPAVKQAVEVLEGLEEEPDKPLDPPFDELFNYVSDLFLGPVRQDLMDDEASVAMWLVAGWWPEVKTIWSGRLLPESWRPLFHDIFGDFFRPVTLSSAWLTSNVLTLSQAIYEERAFDRLPILADALEDAGCTNEEILNHCRQQGEHARGCWVVDLVLGKS